ncbi:MAG: glycosyltransferase family 2 protein [Anaerolineae bacterium]|nr:glycosyltransferase family 2 protein [Anaerolineae bacterium]MCO5187302.1 glycosyltransferase family 2 protein [Anaerolineae bacterium]MCO5191789.1 glycosyltransferase family 2 protein [Anaerolineae bacterium]MCO5207582.1 glycosyltransferase family 2 protein [Anaerolineae bacterium]
MQSDLKVIVVMPAYNAAKTLVETYNSIPADWVDEVILVDDDSIDETALVARDLDLQLIVHPHNAGYGANQKTCYMEALRRDADIVIMLHPDGQYDPKIIPNMISVLADGKGDFVMGSRFLPPKSALAGGMPRYKYISNRFLTAFENLMMRTNLSECHTGYRAYNRKLLETVPFLRNSNDFVFDTQMIFQAAHFDFRFAEVPVTTKYFNEASSISFAASVKYGLSTLWVALRYRLHRLGLWHWDIFNVAHRS